MVPSERMPASPDLAGTAAGDHRPSTLPLPIGAVWIGWRLRLLVLCALTGCIGLFLLAASLTQQRQVDATWVAAPDGRLVLAASRDPQLVPLAGMALTRISGGAGMGRSGGVAVDALLMQHSPRWLVDDGDRLRQAEMNRAFRAAVDADVLTLQFADGRSVTPTLVKRGVAGLGLMFWTLAALALVLYLIGMVVTLARPSGRNAMYTLMVMAQAGNAALMAIESLPGLGSATAVIAAGGPLRMACDLVTASAVLHASVLHPRPLPGGRPWVLAAWVGTGALVALALAEQLPHAWLWTQAVMIGYGLGAVALLSTSHQKHPHPLAVVLRRFGMVAVATLVLLTLAILAMEHNRSVQHHVAAVGSVIWYVFLASLLLLLPFLSRSQQLLREFSLLAGVSTVATSLDLLFVAVFSLGQFASLTLSLFLSLGVYAGVRQWVLNQMTGKRTLTTERMFEQLYRAARRIEARPEQIDEATSEVLRHLFEPIELAVSDVAPAHARVASDGSTLLVPLPVVGRQGTERHRSAVVMRFADRGKRLFTADDARLADRVIDQLSRAVAHDQAVEQGRHEERVRLAQDLHDDIGARLLTLMYQAPNPEVEDYVRHTLQDLKTLTRGLSAQDHRLSHAAAEWKADLSQRLSAAGCELAWSFSADRDAVLTVVQWSALTRILRELVTNTMAHAQASRVDIEGQLLNNALTLMVRDNGIGRDPASWSHGLGLGGVRKRVKQLGGTVEWADCRPCGIRCTVVIPQFLDRPA